MPDICHRVDPMTYYIISVCYSCVLAENISTMWYYVLLITTMTWVSYYFLVNVLIRCYILYKYIYVNLVHKSTISSFKHIVVNIMFLMSFIGKHNILFFIHMTRHRLAHCKKKLKKLEFGDFPLQVGERPLQQSGLSYFRYTSIIKQTFITLPSKSKY